MIFLLLFTIPMVIALVAQYIVCRFPKRRFWRGVPALAVLLMTAAVALYRYHGWSDGAEKAPWETLLFVPGISALGALLGLWLGWRLWHWVWDPRVVKDRK